MKPSNYDDWKHCISVKCGIPMTPDFIEGRIRALRDPEDYHTQKFRDFWGQAHLDQVLGWFESAKKELAA